jgi:hypothetical protein
MSPLNFRRALFVRLDRIGDLVLTLPTDGAASIPAVDWWIPNGLSFVTEHAQPPRNAREFPRNLSLIDALRLAREVRQKSYDLAVIFHAPWWVSLVVWAAGIRVRIGVRSQWHSFLFLNRRDHGNGKRRRISRTASRNCRPQSDLGGRQTRGCRIDFALSECSRRHRAVDRRSSFGSFVWSSDGRNFFERPRSARASLGTARRPRCRRRTAV